MRARLVFARRVQIRAVCPKARCLPLTLTIPPQHLAQHAARSGASAQKMLFVKSCVTLAVSDLIIPVGEGSQSGFGPVMPPVQPAFRTLPIACQFSARVQNGLVHACSNPRRASAAGWIGPCKLARFH